MTEKSLKQRVMELTGVFETSQRPPECFAGLTGNFDGQGLSFGVLQWNLGKESLQPILKELLLNHHEVMRGIFKDDLPKLEEMLAWSKDEQVAWAARLSTIDQFNLIEPWNSYFKSLGVTLECQALQLKYAEEYYQKVEKDFYNLELTSERAYALLFDIAVQLWHVPIDQIWADFDETGVEDEVEKLVIVAKRSAERANVKFRQDVLDRKMCIATGSGKVHGDWICVENFGITMKEAVFEEEYVEV